MNFKNFILGLRNIRKNGVYSIINIAGLSLGIAVVVLILFWVADELNYDKFHTNLDRLYTVFEHQVYSDGQDLYTPCTPFPLSQELVHNYPEVENATTFTNVGRQVIKYENKEFKEGPIIVTDNNFLKVFTFPVIEGNPDALMSPDKVIISSDLAHTYFGDESAIGKILNFDGYINLTVGAVLGEKPKNSTLDFKALVPLQVIQNNWGVNLTAWGNNWPATVALLSNNQVADGLQTRITTLCKDKGQENTSLYLFPYNHERLYSYSGKNNRIQYVYQFIAIAFIIILIASINFINLSVAKAEQRRSEIGVRKVLGAGKPNIIRQFLVEKGMMIIVSLLFSLILVLLLLPLFNTVSDKHISMGLFQNHSMIFMLAGVIVVVTLISVMYPSLYLSSFNPAQTMKHAVPKKGASLNLKNILVVVQFIMSVVLISGSISIAKQIRYVNNYDLGYQKANLVYLPLAGESKESYAAIVGEIKQLSGVSSLCLSNNLPFYGTSSSWGYDWEGKDPNKKVLISQIHVDRNYFETMGIKLTEGTTFSNQFDGVANNEDIIAPQVILNKEAVRRIEMTNPIGKFFGNFNNKKGTIVGVTDDFHFQSLHRGVEPLLITPLTSNPDNIIIRVNSAGFSQTIDAIKDIWNKVLPGSTCEVGFFDNSLEQLYSSEVRISGLFRYFSFIAIFISCIGLFGLSLFIIERRKKEIGVRKVNGAKIYEVMVLLNVDFIKWVIIAFTIATPVAYYVMHRWLDNFAYKTELNWWIFALAGLLALVIALITVSWQSWRAANKNPVEALRYE